MCIIYIRLLATSHEVSEETVWTLRYVHLCRSDLTHSTRNILCLLIRTSICELVASSVYCASGFQYACYLHSIKPIQHRQASRRGVDYFHFSWLCRVLVFLINTYSQLIISAAYHVMGLYTHGITKSGIPSGPKLYFWYRKFAEIPSSIDMYLSRGAPLGMFIQITVSYPVSSFAVRFNM